MRSSSTAHLLPFLLSATPAPKIWWPSTQVTPNHCHDRMETQRVPRFGRNSRLLAALRPAICFFAGFQPPSLQTPQGLYCTCSQIRNTPETLRGYSSPNCTPSIRLYVLPSLLRIQLMYMGSHGARTIRAASWSQPLLHSASLFLSDLAARHFGGLKSEGLAVPSRRIISWVCLSQWLSSFTARFLQDRIRWIISQLPLD